jgi:hypothetical protein
MRSDGRHQPRLLASYPDVMKRLCGLAAPLLALAAFIAFGVVVLVMADIGADVMLDVLHTSAGFN